MLRYDNRSTPGSQIHIAIADLGIGIEAALRPKFPQLGKGSDYLLHSLKMGVSSRPDSGGLGLYKVQEIVRNGQGTFIIRSKSSMIQFYDGEIHQWDNLPLIPGTQIFINIWGKHPQWQGLLSNP